MRRLIVPLLGIVLLFSLAACDQKPNQAIASAQHYASEVGMNILQQGGNAFDAAVAMHYALAVVHPSCGNIGGGGVMTAYLKDGSSTVVDFREYAPKSLSAYHIKSTNPIHSVGIPGSVRGMDYIHEHYGSLPMDSLINPAIDLANEGYEVQEGDANIYRFAEDKVKTSPKAYALFYPDGKIPTIGTKIIQKNLGKTLALIRDQGSESFYRGEISRAILAKSSAYRGKMIPSDLSDYQVEERKPLHCQYRGYSILTAPAPFSGLTLCQTLAILNPMEPNPALDPTPVGILKRIGSLRMAYTDRAALIADPAFVPINTDKLLSEEHLKPMRNYAESYAKSPAPSLSLQEAYEEGLHTTAFVVADKEGNVVSITTTLNSYFGSSLYIDDYGFFLNNEMTDFDTKNPSSANHVEAHKRPMSGMTPTIVLKDNQPVIALGSPGGGTIPTQIINILIKLIDQKLSVEETLQSPRFFPRWNQAVIHIEPGAFDDETIEALQQRGESLQDGMGFIPGIPSWGAVALLYRESQQWQAGMDPRRPAGSSLIFD